MFAYATESGSIGRGDQGGYGSNGSETQWNFSNLDRSDRIQMMYKVLRDGRSPHSSSPDHSQDGSVRIPAPKQVQRNNRDVNIGLGAPKSAGNLGRAGKVAVDQVPIEYMDVKEHTQKNRKDTDGA